MDNDVNQSKEEKKKQDVSNVDITSFWDPFFIIFDLTEKRRLPKNSSEFFLGSFSGFVVLMILVLGIGYLAFPTHFSWSGFILRGVGTVIAFILFVLFIPLFKKNK